jgi:hypothetical protein
MEVKFNAVLLLVYYTSQFISHFPKMRSLRPGSASKPVHALELVRSKVHFTPSTDRRRQNLEKGRWWDTLWHIHEMVTP